MSFPHRSEADEAFRHNDARAEKVTSLVWMAVIALTYSIFLLMAVQGSASSELILYISSLVAIMLPAFGAIVLLIRLGQYSPFLKYINIFLQTTLVSGAILADNIAEGPLYALSSMPPMAYALIPTVTAFRLQPLLGVFSGAIASLQFLLLYFLFLQPDPELIAELPSLGTEVAMMKVVILFALGVVSAFAAQTLRKYFVEYGEVQRTRSRLERSFGRFVAPEIVSRINASEDGMIRPALQQAAIVFGDIRSFTAFASTRDTASVTAVLNEYFQVVCDAVEAEGGMVNKFMGDGYLALFGVYKQNENPCPAAARAVLKISEQSRRVLAPLGLSAGAAANYGEVITGEIGSAERCEFTAIGEAVNLASRLESLNRRLGTSFLITESFLKELDSDEFHTLSKGEFPVRGLQQKLPVWEVLQSEAPNF